MHTEIGMNDNIIIEFTCEAIYKINNKVISVQVVNVIKHIIVLYKQKARNDLQNYT